MPDDQKSQHIEKRIDRTVADAVSVSGSGFLMTIAPKNMGEMLEFAKMLAIAGDCIRPAFRNNPGMCLALALQAFRWGADPFAVANKAYVTTGKAGTQIAYESQLIHAIINSSPALARRLRSRYEGVGVQRKCIVTGWVRGEDEAFEYESPTIAQIAVKNSPLWQGDPDQQLHYYSTRAWARRYLPEVLLGIYTPDEVQGEIIDMTPQQGAVQEAATIAETETPIMWEIADAAGEVYTFEFAERAVEACRKILIASAAVSDAVVSTAWENNTAFIMSLGQEGLEAEAQALERLYAELTPTHDIVPSAKPEPRETEEQDQRDAPPTPAGDAPPATVQGDTDASPAPMAEAPASSPAGNGPTATSGASPSSHDETSEGASSKGRTPDFESGNAGSTPAAPTTNSETRPRDAFWTNESLRIDPAPVSAHSKVPNWKTWPALIEPRLRQVASIAVLNAFYQDNVGNLDVYERACGARARGELDAAFDSARTRLTV